MGSEVRVSAAGTLYALIGNLGLFLNTRGGPRKALSKVRTWSECFNKIALPEGREWIARGKSERGEVSTVGGPVDS